MQVEILNATILFVLRRISFNIGEFSRMLERERWEGKRRQKREGHRDYPRSGELG